MIVGMCGGVKIYKIFKKSRISKVSGSARQSEASSVRSIVNPKHLQSEKELLNDVFFSLKNVFL